VLTSETNIILDYKWYSLRMAIHSAVSVLFASSLTKYNIKEGFWNMLKYIWSAGRTNLSTGKSNSYKKLFYANFFI